MTAPVLPPPGSFLPNAGTDDQVLALMEDWLAVTGKLPGAAVGPDLVLDANNGGRVVPTAARHRVDTFGGAAAGTLAKLGVDTMAPGRRVTLSIVSSLRPITFQHGGGTAEQLLLAGGLTMVASSDTATLEVERKSDGWHEVARNWGTQSVSWLSWIGAGAGAALGLASQAGAEGGVLNTGAMTELRVRQAIVAPGWLQSRFVWGGAVRDADALLYYDGTALYRVAVGGATGVLGTTLRRPFETAQPMVLNAATEYAHGLGVRPRLYTARALCTSTDGGFSAGQEIESANMRAYADATVVGYIAGSPLQAPGGAGLIASHWNAVLRAWAG